MATEKITLGQIQGRLDSDYNLVKSGYPLTGYEESTGPPEATVDSFDITGVTLDVTTFFEGRLCRPEFRLLKDVKVLATILANLGSPIVPGPKKFILVSSLDTKSGYLEEKIDEGSVLITKITDGTGYESLQLDVSVKNSIEVNLNQLQLVNDETAPGNDKFYGTSALGVKGWQSFALTDRRSSVTAADTTSDFLDNKIVDGGAILTTVNTDTTGEQTLDFSILTKNSIHVSADFLAAEMLELFNDENAPGNSKFYGTTTLGVKGWQSFPTKRSIEEDSAELQLVNDETTPGNNRYYGTDLIGAKGWHTFAASAGATVSITVGDIGSGFLDDKVVAGDGLLTVIDTASNGEQLLDFSVLIKNSIEIDLDYLQLSGDENAPGNSKFYGTTVGGVKGWQSLPTKNSIEEDSNELQLINDENAPGNLHYYGTNVGGTKGWHAFTDIPIPAVSVSITDSSSDYLDNKVSDGDGILTTILTDSSSEQTLNFSVLVKNSIEINLDSLQLVNDESAPGNSKFYGTTVGGVKGWQSLPIKNSIEQDSEELQLVNDESAPGNSNYYGTNTGGIKGWHSFTDIPLPSVAISNSDSSSDYLNNKVTDGDGILTSINTDSSSEQTLNFSVLVKNSIEINLDYLQLSGDENAPGNSKFYGTTTLGVKGWQALSDLPADIGIGGSPGASIPTLRRCTIATDTGVITVGDGPDLMLNGSNDITPDQEFIALKVWNAIFNDIADFQELDDELVYGKCYYDTVNGAAICNTRCQESVIGIASDTFGYALGTGNGGVPIAISGWVLAFVDKEYRIGIPLTNNKYGTLTEMTLAEKQMYPERIVAIYKKKEPLKSWGPENKKIEVNNRHWVKIK